MKKCLGYCASLVVGFAMPAWAADSEVSPSIYGATHWGYVDFGAALFSGDEEAIAYDESWDGEEVFLKGAYVWNFASDYSFQLDVSSSSYSEDVSGETGGINPYDFSRSGSSWDVMGHLTQNTASGHRYGVYVDLGGSYSDNNIYAALGLEGQLNYDTWSLYGSLGGDYGIGGDAGSVDSRAVVAQAKATYYVNPNLGLTGFLSGADETWSAGDNSQVNWGLSAEYKLNNSPISVYLEYDDMSFSGENAFDKWDGDQQTIWVGFRYHFQNGTLQQINQNTF